MKTLLILCLAVVGLAGFASPKAKAAVNAPRALPAVAHVNATVVVETGGRGYHRYHRHHEYRRHHARRWYYRHHRRYYY